MQQQFMLPMEDLLLLLLLLLPLLKLLLQMGRIQAFKHPKQKGPLRGPLLGAPLELRLLLESQGSHAA